MDAIHELMGGTGSVGGNEARQHVNKVFETITTHLVLFFAFANCILIFYFSDT